MIGVYLAHAKIGKHMSDDQQKELLETLRKMGINTSIAETIYQRTFRVKQQFGAATPGAGKSDEAVRNEFMVQVNNTVRAKQPKDQADTFHALLKPFYELNNPDGSLLDPNNAGDRMKIVQMTDNNSTLFGHANALLRQAEGIKDSNVKAAIMDDPVFKALRQQSGRFIALDVSQALPSVKKQLVRTNPKKSIEAMEHLQELLGRQITPETWLMLPEEYRRTLQETYIKGDGKTVKEDLRNLIVNTLKTGLQQHGIAPRDVQRIEREIVNFATQAARVDAVDLAPALTDSADLKAVLSRINKENLTDDLHNQLRSYNRMAENYQVVHERAAQQKLVGQTAAAPGRASGRPGLQLPGAPSGASGSGRPGLQSNSSAPAQPRSKGRPGVGYTPPPTTVSINVPVQPTQSGQPAGLPPAPPQTPTAPSVPPTPPTPGQPPATPPKRKGQRPGT
jgi:hypothetical protein